MSEAATLRCPACGAPADPRAGSCAHCRAHLTPTRCPWCFAWTYAEAKDCFRCGSAAAPPPEKPSACPTCRQALYPRERDGARLSCCAGCGGVWSDADSFRRICEAREAHSAYLGAAQALPAPKTHDPSEEKIRYRPCPVCGELMNRFNFADISGVVLDACKPHGVWFDPDELRRVVKFVRTGGLDLARERERGRLRDERRRLERAADDRRAAAAGMMDPREMRGSIGAVRALGGLFGF